MANANWNNDLWGTPGAPINVAQSDPRMLGRVIAAGPAKRTVQTVPIGPLGNPAVNAINRAVPGANGSTILNKDMSQLAPSPNGLPANYGQPNPPVFGGSWANFADTMGSGWRGDAATAPPIAPDSKFGGPPGLTGAMNALGMGQGTPMPQQAPAPIRRPAPGWEPGKTPNMAAYDKGQADFYRGVNNKSSVTRVSHGGPSSRMDRLLAAGATDSPARSTPIPRQRPAATGRVGLFGIGRG